MNNAIQWIVYVQNITYKKYFPFFHNSLRLFLPLGFFFLRQKLGKQYMLFNPKYVQNREKKSEKSTEQQC